MMMPTRTLLTRTHPDFLVICGMPDGGSGAFRRKCRDGRYPRQMAVVPRSGSRVAWRVTPAWERVVVSSSTLLSLPMDLRDAQREVDAYISQFREGYFPPLVNLARLTEEVGELARELNHLHGKKTRKVDEAMGDVALELADILFVVIVLANQLGVDLQTAMEGTLEKYRVRDADRWELKEPDSG